MIVKDHAADLKLCPLTLGQGKAESKCAGSACAAWREVNTKGDGYCGMAGTPPIVAVNITLHGMLRAMKAHGIVPGESAPDTAPLPDLASLEPQGRA